MNDGPGRGTGSAPESGHNDSRQGWPTPRTGEPEPRVLEGRVIPSQKRGSAMPQRKPGQSGHLPGAHATRRAAQRAAQQAAVGQQPGAQQPHEPGSHRPPLPQRDTSPRQEPPSPLPLPGTQPEPPRPFPRPAGRHAQPGGPQPRPQPLTPSFQPRGDRRPEEPDWNALASANEKRKRRRRMLLISAGTLAAAVAAGVVTYTVAGSGTGPGPEVEASGKPADAASAQPEFPEVTPPPPPDPLELIASAETDTAPINTDTLFPGKRFTFDDRAGRTYTEGLTSSTKDCASVGLDGLGPILKKNGCRQLLRATYTRDGVSVTVGIAVFDERKSANAVRETLAKQRTSAHIAPLFGKGVAKFCTPVSCWSSYNAIGRYAYFTIAGLSNNKPVSSTETEAKQAGKDASRFVFDQLTQRGKRAAGQ